MENDERIVRTISVEIDRLQAQLNEYLEALQQRMEVSGPDWQDSRSRNLYILVERIDSARVHLSVASEYLKGNGERAFIRDERVVLDYVESMRG